MLQFRMAADRFAELLKSSLQETFTMCESMCIQQWEDTADMLENCFGGWAFASVSKFLVCV